MKHTIIHAQSLEFLEAKIKEHLGVNVADLDFTTLEDGVFAVDDWGKSFMVTNNPAYMSWFKAYEDLRYGAVS
jgi:hypothetical protein